MTYSSHHGRGGRFHCESRAPRRARDGMVLGVCKGLARHFDIATIWVRVIAVVLLIGSSFWPAIVLYVLAALVMKPEPFATAEQGMPDSRATPPCPPPGSPRMAGSMDGGPSRAQQLKTRFDRLERRLRRMEDVVTSREFQWENRLGDRRPNR